MDKEIDMQDVLELIDAMLLSEEGQDPKVAEVLEALYENIEAMQES